MQADVISFGALAASIILVLSVMTGCEESSPIVDLPKTTPPPIIKSVKRGIAYNIASAVDLAALSSGVSWWYNWGKTPSSNLPAKYRGSKQLLGGRIRSVVTFAG
jgi:hypothetical protein